MQTLKRYLVVRADGSGRVTTRLPRLRSDEVAFPLTVRIPDCWGRLAVGSPVVLELPGGDDVPTVILDGEPFTLTETTEEGEGDAVYSN